MVNAYARVRSVGVCERERSVFFFLIEKKKKYDVDEQYLAQWGEILFIAKFWWPS